MSNYRRGYQFEKLCAVAFGGVRQRNDYTGGPDVISDSLVVSCKRVTETGIRGVWIEQARGYGAKHRKDWLLVRALRGKRHSVVVMDTTFALELLRQAGKIPDEITVEVDDRIEPEVPR